MVTDRYRYLPCALHPALAAPRWWACLGGGPLVPGPSDGWLVDLQHPAGWDHAVRALAVMRGGTVDESCSVSFEWTACGWEMVGARVPPQPQWRFPGVRCDTPYGRREALCRCICAALGRDVGEVFP